MVTLPGQTLVIYDPNNGLITDIVASEDAHQGERAWAAPLLASAQPGQLWIGDRHFCTRAIMQGWDEAHASFIVREQAIAGVGAQAPWRRIKLALDTPTEAGERVISPARLRAGRLWSNPPEAIGADSLGDLLRPGRVLQAGGAQADHQRRPSVSTATWRWRSVLPAS